ncbi:MAG TPA: BON domain-containing protein [Nitrospiraceae bacterium]|nr:BON domain-containing protein [Nitrospiraceae bacterium]
MNILKSCALLLTIGLVGAMTGCSSDTKSPDVARSIRTSLDQAGFKDVSVSQDRDKGVVTLTGHVPVESDKSQAESIAKSLAGAQVVANQIAVTPPGAESEAKDVDSALDKGIKGNLDAALIKEKLNDDVKYSVKNGVITLKGEVTSQAKRVRAEKVAAGLVNVKQVVNELEVKGQKATSTK